MSKKQKKMLTRILVTAVLLTALFFVPVSGVLKLCLYLGVYLIIGYDILRKAVKGIFNGRVFDENFLMASATVGAFVLAIYTNSGDYIEGIAVMLFYQVGELFQSYAVGKSRKSITALMDIRPDYANIKKGDTIETVDPEEVAVGDIIVVRPGEKVPLDGIVVKGESTLNTSALTGESVPRDINEGGEIISGCINMTGVLEVRTTKEFGESTVSKILDLVENASSRKSRSEAFISRFASVYTPIVCISAFLLAVVPPLVRILLLSLSGQWDVWIYRALTFLVVSCPCALVISIPLSFFAGIGGASREGVLVKGSNYLEALSKTKCVVFDKTGTLTEGVFEVTEICPKNIDKDTLLEYAALAECASSHPISKSLIKAYGKDTDLNRVADITEISGHGVTAVVDGVKVAAGNVNLMEKLSVSFTPCANAGTAVYIALDGVYAGYILISDKIKPRAKQAVNALKRNGVQKTVMLTGDVDSAARQVSAELGIDEFHSGLLPADKVSMVEEVISRSQAGTVAFAGDGINDAPVLTRADIGIAMGALGSDAAIEAADVVLMDDDPMQIVKAIRISRKCLRIVYQNITFALVVKFACLLLSAFGIANMWLAIFADVGVMIIAVLNAMRALRA